MNPLIKNNGDIEAAADKIKELKQTQFIDGVVNAINNNTVARKAEQIRRGEVTQVIIKVRKACVSTLFIIGPNAPIMILQPASPYSKYAAHWIGSARQWWKKMPPWC